MVISIGEAAGAIRLVSRAPHLAFSVKMSGMVRAHDGVGRYESPVFSDAYRPEGVLTFGAHKGSTIKQMRVGGDSQFIEEPEHAGVIASAFRAEPHNISSWSSCFLPKRDIERLALGEIVYSKCRPAISGALATFSGGAAGTKIVIETLGHIEALLVVGIIARNV